MDRVQKNYWI